MAKNMEKEDIDVQMVGNSSLFIDCRNRVVAKMRPDELCLFSFLGEKGSGRTATAKFLFDEASCTGFDCWAWVSVGTDFQLKHVLMSILSQVQVQVLDDEFLTISKGDEEFISKHVYKGLENRRYMKTPSCLCHHCLERRRSIGVGNLLFDVFFDVDSISPQLVEAGSKIVDNCGDRIVSVVKSLLFLAKRETSLDLWSEIAADPENPVFVVADELSEISKIEAELQSGHWDIDEERRKGIAEAISGMWVIDDVVGRIKMKMYPQRFFAKTQIISLWGMAGIGKTTFARKIFQDDSVLRRFDHCVVINLGPRYQKEDILIDILNQIYPNIHKFHMNANENLVRNLCAQLSQKRCLILLDDLCSKEPINHLKHVFPDIKGTILVTTRLAKATKFERDDIDFQMELLDEEESWLLFCQNVFVGELCPPQLEKAGRKIAEKCDGLPLLIIAVADQLLKADISQKYWDDVASGKEKSVFKNSHHQISEALSPSYLTLPRYLRACFLYLGVFRQYYEISTSKLSSLWIAEGILEPRYPQTLEDFATECLFKLSDRSLIMVHHRVSYHQFKTCRLHSVFWYLSNDAAAKNNFFHAMNSYEDCFMEGMQSYRALCVRNSPLLGIKDVHSEISCIRGTRSFSCVGRRQHYPIPLNFNLKLLRVMNVLAIRLYEFPLEIVNLIHLRYLSLTCNGKLPASISNLWKLQYLIVKRYISTKLSNNSHLLPVEIWDMKELKHLQVMGGCLPNHRSGVGLLNLSTLLDVSIQSCRNEILKWIPNLNKLGIRIELAPNDESNSFHSLDLMSCLHRLESLKCVVVNPRIKATVVPPSAPLLMFASNLKKLSLSGMGYPWEYMAIIGKLENLEVLKLKHYAFQGPKWEMDPAIQFKRLKVLLLESANLVQWQVESKFSMKLESLHIGQCYKLQELPVEFRANRLKMISIVDCNPDTVSWAKKMEEMMDACKVNIHHSSIARIETTKDDSQSKLQS